MAEFVDVGVVDVDGVFAGRWGAVGVGVPSAQAGEVGD